MEKSLNSAMITEEINALKTRQQEIATQIEERKSAFEVEADVEKRDALLSETEQLKNDFEGLENDVKKAEEKREKFMKQEESMSLIKTVSAPMVDQRKKQDVYGSAEYRDAYIDWIKYQTENPILRAGLTTTTAAPVVPTILQNYIETAWAKYGNIADLCDIISVKGYYSVPMELTATDAVIHPEGSDAPGEETITMGSIVIKPAMVKKWISLTDEVMALTGDEFMRYVADELVYRIYKKFNDEIINGTATNGVGLKGILVDTNTVSVTSTLTFNAINSALAELIQFDNLTVVMNPKTFFKNILGLADTAGRPIYTVATDNTGKPKYFINGIKVEFSDSISAYDDAVTAKSTAWAIVGDFKAYKINMPNGKVPQLLYDPYTSAKADKEEVVGKLLAGGAITKKKRLAKLLTPAS